MSEKFLKEVVGLVVGKQAEELAVLLNNKKYINEFIIAKKMDVTINQMRNMLYKISDVGLVSSERKKDKKKGWYTYFWKLDVLKCLEFLREDTLKKTGQIRSQIKSRETKKFYVCDRCHTELSEENALLHEFTCNECGDVFSLKDDTKLIRELSNNLQKLEKKLEMLEAEIKKEQAKVDKEKEKQLKKIEKEKSEKRRKMKEASGKIPKKSAKDSKQILTLSSKNRERKKVNKKIKKKPVKKKPVKKKIKKKSVKSKLKKKIPKKKKSRKKK